MKYEITYETENGKGTATIVGYEIELNKMIAELQSKGCSNISYKAVIDYDDPCSSCRNDLYCHNCPYREDLE